MRTSLLVTRELPQPSVLELEKFLSRFHSLQKEASNRAFFELEAFFLELGLLEGKKTKARSEMDEAVPIDDMEYQRFLSTFDSLYTNEKRRGVEVNVWDVAGLKRNEVRNTAVLAWWLDCNGSHGLGDLLFKVLLEALPANNDLPTLNTICNNYRVKTESHPLAERESRIDIEIEGDDFLIFIEIKIDAVEGHEQLSRYQELINKKKAVCGMVNHGIVYLTRNESRETSSEEYVGLRWKQLSRAFRAVKLPHQPVLAKHLLTQFCEHIESF